MVAKSPRDAPDSADSARTVITGPPREGILGREFTSVRTKQMISISPASPLSRPNSTSPDIGRLTSGKFVAIKAEKAK